MTENDTDAFIDGSDTRTGSSASVKLKAVCQLTAASPNPTTTEANQLREHVEIGALPQEESDRYLLLLA